MKITEKRVKGKRVYEVKGYLGDYTDEFGKKHKKMFHRNYASSKEAKLEFERAKNEFKKFKVSGQRVQKQPKFRDVYLVWLKTYRLGVKESTLNRVETLFRLHITPYLGEMHMNEITWQICERAVLKWRKELVEFNKAKQYAGLVFRTAQKMGAIISNPMELVDVPEQTKDFSTADDDRNFWTGDELATFLDAVDRLSLHDKRHRYDRPALFYLLATTGMRKGELIALTWGDINFSRSTVTINKTMTRKKDNSQTVGTPKTRNAYRTLKVEPDTLERLKTYRRNLKVIPKANETIFKNTKGKYLSLMTPNHWLDSLTKKLDIPRITVHGLRHTFASVQIAQGIEPKALQLQMGHSDIKITLNIYAHLTQDQVAASVFNVSDAVRPRKNARVN